MLTLFAIPKAFKGHIGVIQRNAIGSWTQLKPQPEIILFGRDEGTAEVARQFGVQHIPDVATNEFGTPLLGDLFRKAEAAARFPTIAYVNSDIILMREFVRSVEIVQRQMPISLMVSKRINIDCPEPLRFGPEWSDKLKHRVESDGVEGHYSAIDIFVYSKGMYPSVPDFALGRLWFDHWMIKAIRLQNRPVVDASLLSPLIHQNHDYNHVPGGEDQVWRGKEAERNFQLYGGIQHAYTLLDVTHELTRDGAIRKVRFRKPLHKVKVLAWKTFIEKTVGVRNALGMRRRFWQRETATTRG